MNINNSNEYKKITNKIIYSRNINNELTTKNNEDFKKKFLNFLAKMHNLLRGCAVTGDHALDDILYCLLLCYLDKKINNEGVFDLQNIHNTCYDVIPEKKIKLYVKYLNINFLLNNTEELRIKDATNSIEKCAKLYSQHPKTKPLFKDEDFINCPDPGILSTLLEECQTFSKNTNIFENIDLIGIAYEYMNTKYSGNGGTSKDMGQYFTERPLIEMCLELVDKDDIEDLKINDDSTIGDEFCATFGFPLVAKKFLKNRFNINISDENMYGVEYHERLARFAYMNALFSMNNVTNIIRGDSFTTNVYPHLDFSIHNVPFGQSMSPKIIEKTYNRFIKDNKDREYPKIDEYLPFCSKKIDSILASQVVLYKTTKMGLLIIKDGEETSSKSNADFRKWFCNNCVVKKIMKIPGNAFSCTSTKTVCIYFIKKDKEYTKNIQFLKLSENGNQITEICNISTNDLANHYYSWDPNTYLIDTTFDNIKIKKDCNWNQVKDICKITFGDRITKKNKHTPDGKYYVYGGGNLSNTFKIDEYNRDGFTCKISRFAASSHNCVMLLSNKYWLNDSGFTINSNSISLKTKFLAYYLYYYLNNNKPIFNNLYRGSGQQNIDIDKFYDIYIPIPILTIQENCISILDDLNNQIELLEKRKLGINNQIRYYFQNNLNDVTCVKLNTLTQINIGSTPSTKDSMYWDNGSNIWITVSELNNNLIPIVDSKKKITDIAINNCKPKLVKKGSILMSFKLSIGKLGIAGSDLYTNEAILHIDTQCLELNKYLYYHLFSLPINNNASGCIGNGSLNKEKLKDINIYIQKDKNKRLEIIEYLDILETEKNSIDSKINNINLLNKKVIENTYKL